MPLCWNWRIESLVPTDTLFGQGNLVFPKSFIVCAVNLANFQVQVIAMASINLCVVFRGSIVFMIYFFSDPEDIEWFSAANICPPAGEQRWSNPKTGHNFGGRNRNRMFRFVLLLSRYEVSSACQLKKLTMSSWYCYRQFRLVTSGECLSLPGIVAGNWEESCLSVFYSLLKKFNWWVQIM